MHASTHKKIIMAGCGCAALLGVVTAIGLVLVLLEDPDFFRSEFRLQEDTFTAERARAALDSLGQLDLAALGRLPVRDRYSLPARRTGDGAVTAVRAWTDTALARGFVSFGDTFPEGDRRRRRWVEASEWDVVDSLRVAGLRPWSLASALPAADSAGDVTAGFLIPQRVLSATRAVLARARLADVRGDAAEADTLVRAVITIGRWLQRDHRLYHVLLGARTEWEAFHVLAGIETQGGRRGATPRTLAALARADSAGAAVGRVYRLLVVAGALAEHCDDLLALAADRRVPLAVRHEAVIAIGYGWAFAPDEQMTVDARRGEALAGVERGDPPPPAELRLAAQAGRRLTELTFFRRVEATARHRLVWNAWRWAG